NTNRTLNLNSSGIGWISPHGASVLGGVINLGPGGGFNMSSPGIGPSNLPAVGLTLTGVTLNGNLEVPSGGGRVSIATSLNLNGSITARATQSLNFPNTPANRISTITGGTIELLPADSAAVNATIGAAGTLILSPTTLLRGGGTSAG